MNNIKNKFSLKNLTFLFIALIAFSVGGVKASEKRAVNDKELLILSMLAYSNYPTEKGKSDCSVTEIWEESFADVAINCWEGNRDLVKNMDGWFVYDYDINTGEDLFGEKGFSVISFKKDNNIVVAFRGTDQGLFFENWKYIIHYTEHPQSVYVSAYLGKLKQKGKLNGDVNVYFTGHSLGGYLALYATGLFLSDNNFKRKFVRTATFNGLGIGFTDGYKVRKNLSKLNDDQLVNYRIDGDAVSRMGKHFKNVVTIKFTYINSNWSKVFAWTQAPHLITQFFFSGYFDKVS